MHIRLSSDRWEGTDWLKEIGLTIHLDVYLEHRWP